MHVGEISIDVQNLTAKINLDAQVLQLLQFNAGVDLSISRVRLLIQNVTAKVVLEARLANLVLMIVSSSSRNLINLANEPCYRTTPSPPSTSTPSSPSSAMASAPSSTTRAT